MDHREPWQRRFHHPRDEANHTSAKFAKPAPPSANPDDDARDSPSSTSPPGKPDTREALSRKSGRDNVLHESGQRTRFQQPRRSSQTNQRARGFDELVLLAGRLHRRNLSRLVGAVEGGRPRGFNRRGSRRAAYAPRPTAPRRALRRARCTAPRIARGRPGADRLPAGRG